MVNSNWRLHHNNAPGHSSHLIQTFFFAKNQTLFYQAPYFPDRAPCDFWLFPKLKRPNFGYFSNNENRARTLSTTSLKCCLPSTDAINRREIIHAFVWRFKVPSCKCASLQSMRFSQKKSSDIFLTE